MGEAEDGHCDPDTGDIMEALITDEEVAEGGEEKAVDLVNEEVAVCDKSVGSERERE